MEGKNILNSADYEVVFKITISRFSPKGLSMKKCCILRLNRYLIAIFLSTQFMGCCDKVYGEESWKDIAKELRGRIGNSTHEQILQKYSPLFVNVTSIKRINSVNHRGRVFRRADFSYFSYGQSYRKRIVVDCHDWFYKENDIDHDWSWVPPSEYVTVANNGLEYLMLKYLCANSEEPWKPFVEAKNGTKYFYNQSLYSAKSHWYGELKYVYVADGGTGSSSSLKAYASCPKKLFALYAWGDDPGANYIDMGSVNPLSVGEAMIERMCGFPTRARDTVPSPNDNSTTRTTETQNIVDRYQKALEEQEEMMRGLMGR
jgi:hypothetical protein